MNMPKTYIEEKTASSTNGIEKIENPHIKD
jgi:hypothetical protein